MTPREQAEQLIRDCEIGPHCNICKTLRALLDEQRHQLPSQNEQNWAGHPSAESTVETQRQTLQAIAAEMRTIQMVAGQCSVEGPEDAKSLMAAAESERCRKWADAIEAALQPGPRHENDALRKRLEVVTSTVPQTSDTEPESGLERQR